MALIELAHGPLTATIDLEAGGRIASFEVNGHEALVTAARSPLDWGMYTMVPYAGRVRDARFVFGGTEHRLPMVTDGHAIHGTVLDAHWQCDSYTATEAHLSVDLGVSWPFRGRCTHHVALLPDRLRCVLAVQAVDTMPVQLGWHPWFCTPRHVSTDFNAMLRRGDDGITTTERTEPAAPPVDDCFLEPNAWPRVTTAGGTIEIASDCPFWVRFDAPFGDVCIEPQSGPPNGINDAPLVINAGDTFRRWLELRIVA